MVFGYLIVTDSTLCRGLRVLYKILKVRAFVTEEDAKKLIEKLEEIKRDITMPCHVVQVHHGVVPCKYFIDHAIGILQDFIEAKDYTAKEAARNAFNKLIEASLAETFSSVKVM